MPLTEIQLGQQNFLMRGGTYELPLQMLRKAGILADGYEFHEYPKLLRVNPRTVTAPRIIDLCTGAKETVSETRTVYDEIIVNSEDEEERVLSGGKTTVQMEEERQGLLFRCRQNGIPADPTWSAVRLRRELGDALDAPPPNDRMAQLEAELAYERKIAAMEEEITQLKARRLAPAEDPEDLRNELAALGVKVDGHWSMARLREELDRATSPQTGA